MDTKPLTTAEAIVRLTDKAKSVTLPPGMVDKLNDMFAQLEINSRSEDTFWQNYQTISKYLEWVISLKA